MSPLAGIEFNPTVLIVNGVRTPLGDPPEESITVSAEDYPPEWQCQVRVDY